MNSRPSGSRPSSWTGTIPGCWSWPADLRLLDEAADHLGVVAVLLPDNLDREVPAEFDVAPREDRAHPAPGELDREPVADGMALNPGISDGAGG